MSPKINTCAYSPCFPVYSKHFHWTSLTYFPTPSYHFNFLFINCSTSVQFLIEHFWNVFLIRSYVSWYVHIESSWGWPQIKYRWISVWGFCICRLNQLCIENIWKKKFQKGPKSNTWICCALATVSATLLFNYIMSFENIWSHMKVQICNGTFIWSYVKHHLEPQQLNHIHLFYFRSGNLYMFFDCQEEGMKKGEQWGENERSGILKGSKDLSCQRKQFDELWVKQNEFSFPKKFMAQSLGVKCLAKQTMYFS